MKRSPLRAASLFVLFSASLSAHATLLDFENLGSQGTDLGNNVTSYGTSVTTQGYSLSTSGNAFGNSGFFAYGPGNEQSGLDYTGSVALDDITGGSFVTLTKIGGGEFGVSSIDLANRYTQAVNPTSATVGILGTRQDGTTVSQTIALQATDGLQREALSGFTGLVSLRLGSQDFPYYQFDNVVVTQAVPEPSVLAALGLGAIAVLRRRKRA